MPAERLTVVRNLLQDAAYEIVYNTIDGGPKNTKEVRHEVHWLLEHIPESDVSTARKFLRSLVDPVALSLLNAPYDDEPATEAEETVVEAARREPGCGTPHEEVLREFGL